MRLNNFIKHDFLMAILKDDIEEVNRRLNLNEAIPGYVEEGQKICALSLIAFNNRHKMLKLMLKNMPSRLDEKKEALIKCLENENTKSALILLKYNDQNIITQDIYNKYKNEIYSSFTLFKYIHDNKLISDENEFTNFGIAQAKNKKHLGYLLENQTIRNSIGYLKEASSNLDVFRNEAKYNLFMANYKPVIIEHLSKIKEEDFILYKQEPMKNNEINYDFVYNKLIDEAMKKRLYNSLQPEIKNKEIKNRIKI